MTRPADPRIAQSVHKSGCSTVELPCENEIDQAAVNKDRGGNGASGITSIFPKDPIGQTHFEVCINAQIMGSVTPVGSRN